MNPTARVEKMRRTMEEDGLDGLILTQPENIRYFSGSSRGGLALIPVEASPILYVYRLDYQMALDEAVGFRVKYGRNPLKKMLRDMAGMKLRKVGFDQLTLSAYNVLNKALKRVKVVDYNRKVHGLRAVKDEEEISYIREACRIASKGMEAAYETLKPGVRECEVAAAACRAMRMEGSEEDAFPMIVASGVRSAYPHGGCTRRRIGRGELVVVDLGATYMGYRSDMTRTFVAGEPSGRQVEVWEAVLEAYSKALENVRDGVPAREVDLTARHVLERRGFGRFFIHSLGHGVGLSVHEHPVLSRYSREKLVKGNVVTCEPAVYIHGFGGVRLENTVLVSDGRAEELTVFPMDLL